MVMQITIVIVAKIVRSGTMLEATEQPLNSAPLRAVATRPVPCRMASATVR